MARIDRTGHCKYQEGDEVLRVPRFEGSKAWAVYRNARGATSGEWVDIARLPQSHRPPDLLAAQSGTSRPAAPKAAPRTKARAPFPYSWADVLQIAEGRGVDTAPLVTLQKRGNTSSTGFRHLNAELKRRTRELQEANDVAARFAGLGPRSSASAAS